jgi:hypothetical protein
MPDVNELANNPELRRLAEQFGGMGGTGGGAGSGSNNGSNNSDMYS